LNFVIKDNQSSNLYYKKDLKTNNSNNKTVLIEACQAIKYENAALSRAQKAQKTNIACILFETIILFCERLTSIIKIDKSISTLVENFFFFDFALFFVSRDSKLLKRYAKKPEIEIETVR